MTQPLYVTICAIAAIVLALALTLWPIKTRRNEWRLEVDQWLSASDCKYFAGLFVAVDIDTREIVAAASTEDTIRADVERLRPERACRIIQVPGTPRESLKLLLDIGPCVSESEFQNADGE